MMEISKNEFKALVSLLDDEDAEVNRHVEEKIMSLGSEIIPYLEEQWESSFDPSMAIARLINTSPSGSWSGLKNLPSTERHCSSNDNGIPLAKPLPNVAKSGVTPNNS